jgi:NitT/TauT family transport system substrate-binding protein
MRILVLLLVAGILGVVIFATGCVQEQQSDVGMAVEFNDHAACAYVAKEKGWYKDEGINFTAYESYATGMRLASALARGDIQVAYICLSPAILAYSRGVPIKIVAGTHKYGYGLVVSPCITNVSDLEGKTIGQDSAYESVETGRCPGNREDRCGISTRTSCNRCRV